MKNTCWILLLTTAGLISCNNSDTSPDPVEFDATAILENVSLNVITETYHELYLEAEALRNAVLAFQSNPNESNLENARQAWRNARIPWEQSEGFLFGPVDTKGIDPAIDSWPVNTVDLDAVLAAGDALTKSYIDGLEGTLKGFHTIEYLLWGETGNKLTSSFTNREYEYLVACTESLSGATTELYNAWSPTGENFQEHIAGAGNSGNIFYPSQKSAMQELVNGCIGIADEVANGKINDPFSQQDLTLEESRFSANSKADFADNIRSIRNVFEGHTDTGGDGNGLGTFILETEEALYLEVLDQIEAAITMLENIPGTFSDAIFSNPQSVANAQQEVRDLQFLFESEVKPLIDAL